MDVDAQELLQEAAFMALQIRLLEKRIAQLEALLAQEPEPARERDLP